MTRYATIIVGPDKYEVLVEFEASYDGSSGYTSFTAEEQKRVVILCEHCKNFRLEPIVLYSVDALVEAGWIRKVEETNEPENTRPST